MAHLAESQKKVLRTLEKGPQTYEELAANSGLSYHGVRGRVSELNKLGYKIQRIRDGKNTILRYEGSDEMDRRELQGPDTLAEIVTNKAKAIDDYYSITELLNGIRKDGSGYKKKKITYGERAGVLVLSDLHFGDIVENEGKIIYNSKIANERLESLTNDVIKRMKDGKIENIYVAMLGDIVDGDVIYKNQMFNVEKPAIEQVKDAAQGLSHMLKAFSKEGLKVEVGCVRGNHGITNYKNLEQDNWDNVVYDMLNLVFEDNDDVHVNHFINNEMKVKVLDKQFVLTHGDLIPPQIKTASGGREFRGLCGKHKLVDGDIILAGHLHSFNVEVDQAKFLIRNGAMTNSSEYALEKNLYNDAAQILLIIENNRRHPDIIPLEFEGGITP